MSSRIRQNSKVDFSGAVQDITSWLLKKPNELKDGYNLRFNYELGSFQRRDGFQKTGSSPAVFATGKTPRGAFLMRFSTGGVRVVAVNNSGATATILRTQNATTGAWTDLSGIPSIPADSEIFFFNYLDEVYVTGYNRATGDPITPFNIDKTLSVSTTRNILNMPACYYIAEFGGQLYACNVKIGSTRYPNRAYQSTGPLGAITFIQGAQSGILTSLPVDSVRYLKPGMVIDIYKAGTETKLYDSITLTAVDKNLQTFSFAFSGSSFTADSTTDQLTVSSTASYVTGQPVTVTNSGGSLPTGLVAGTVYYLIVVDATHLKLATSTANASAGTAIDITANGSGTQTLTLQISLSDNDEIWLHGRKGMTTMYWNTDYPTTETAEFLGVQPGVDSDFAITGVLKSSNRLFLFTRYSGNRWDGQNLVTYNSTVGCISMRSLQNLEDDWMVWLDADGNVRARNETTGQQEKISKPIYNKWLRPFAQSVLKDANATTFGSTYKLYVGTDANGNYVRLVYEFDTNTWSPERLAAPALCQFTDDLAGNNKPYFVSTTGYLYQDESGSDDDGAVIPMLGETGHDLLGTEQIKQYWGFLIFSQNASGMDLMVSVEEGDWITLGQITGHVTLIKVPENGPTKLADGSYINVRVAGSSRGDSPVIRGIVTYFIAREDQPNERVR